MRSLALLPALTLIACASCGREEPEPPRPLYLVPAALEAEAPAEAEGSVIVTVEVVADPRGRSRGLMERESLPPDGGMLFVYPSERELEFWMKNTRIPLSIAFLDRSGEIVRILDMEPDHRDPARPLPRYRSGSPALFALEMEKGWFREHGARVGDRVRFHPIILQIRAE